MKKWISAILVSCLILAGCGSSIGARDNHYQLPEAESEHTCYLTIECTSILDNKEKLSKEKAAFVPEDGIIVSQTEVDYQPGESVYDFLNRICKENKLHMEASYTPLYDAYYIEGINQLYEFDCGSLSGWTYKVNGIAPNYGCSKYEISDGDDIVWSYTCNLGVDVGAETDE